MERSRRRIVKISDAVGTVIKTTTTAIRAVKDLLNSPKPVAVPLVNPLARAKSAGAMDVVAHAAYVRAETPVKVASA